MTPGARGPVPGSSGARNARGHDRRVFLPASSALPAGTLSPLTPGDARHLLVVLRLGPGCPVTVADPETGTEREGFVGPDPSAPSVLLGRPLGTPRRRAPRPPVASLLFALCKGGTNDDVCERLTELGIDRITFFVAERSVVRPRPDDAAKKVERWRRIAAAASAQSGRSTLPAVEFYPDLESALRPLEGVAGGSRLLCSLSPEAPGPSAAHLAGGPVHLLIGPEGDVTPGEAGRLAEAGFSPLSLGPARLRSGTAAIAAVAALFGAAATDGRTVHPEVP